MESWQDIFLILTLILYNGAILVAAMRIGRADLPGLLKEKSSEPMIRGGASETDQPGPDSGLSLPASSSRVSGAIGAGVLASFTWAIGNILLFKAMHAPEEIETLLSGIGSFYLAGSALFAPYAFNKLSTALTGR
ncbi:hypothetical protein [Citreimonas sp.]|uniref:hypothetical protein n=1 Tax=Citreimonas sp. TaxID=3036715 RepID=UPI0035C7B79F